MGDIVIRDETMGESRTFTPTVAGYAQADAYMQSIVQQGHKVGGDVGRVTDYMGH